MEEMTLDSRRIVIVLAREDQVMDKEGSEAAKQGS